MKSIGRFFAPPVFEGYDENRRAQIVNSILLGVIFVSLFLTLAGLLTAQYDGVRARSLVFSAGTLLWLVFKRGNLLIPGVVFPLLILGAITNLMWNGQGVRESVVLGFPIVLALGSFILGGRSSIFFTLTAMSAITLTGLAQIQGYLPHAAALSPNYFDLILMNTLTGLMGTLLYILSNHLNQSLTFARDKAQNALRSNQELTAIRQELEIRVTERTRDLTIAAEIGRAVVQEHDLEVLLPAAVERIHQTFALYYAQIYLTDAPGRTLFLRAGAGDVGQTLLQRGHRLPIAPGSINGLTAFTKKAILVEDTAQSSTFLPNPLLPNTRSEMSLPLFSGERVLGVLNLQSEFPNTFTQDTLPAYEILAGQLAAALANAYQFAEAEKARAQVENQAQFLSRAGWDTYLDAIHQPEYLGILYEEGRVETLPAPRPLNAPHTFEVPIAIGKEMIGAIQIESDARPLTPDEEEIVTRLAALASQHLENLRLLNEAERYRHEAEQATRRLTHEGWDTYLKPTAETGLGFTYTNHRVKALKKETALPAPATLHPLTLRGESIGNLALTLPENDAPLPPETTDLIATVADALVNHLENLRLFQATETALAETERQARSLTQLNEMSTALSQTNQLKGLIRITLQEAPVLLHADVAGLALLTPDQEHMEAFILQNDRVIQIVTPEGTVIPLTNTSAEKVLQERRITITHDTSQSPLLDLQDMARTGMVNVIQAPLVLGPRPLGLLNVMSFSPQRRFTEQDARLLQQIAAVVATTLENQRLLEQTTQRAERESLINTINQHVQSTTTVEKALEIAAREIGHLLKARRTVVEIHTVPQNGQ